MSKWLKAGITLALLAAFSAALYFSFSKTQQTAIAGGGTVRSLPGLGAELIELQGLLSLDVEAYFKDERVIKALAAQKVRVTASRVGSREMAGKVAAGGPDFMFPSGVVAANQILDAAKAAKIQATQSSPFYTPMVVASWTTIAGILQANGMAEKTGERLYALDTQKLTAAMLAKKRWKDLSGAQAYDVSKGVLVSTTDVRKSNSAAMYLALTSYAANGGELVTDRATAESVSRRVAELFKRQGYQENYVNGNFDDYTAIGVGKTPMAFIYENQMLSYALAKKGVAADMVLMYPRPTIINKVVFVALSDKAKRLGDLLNQDAELQGLAVEYGFRIADTKRFADAAKGAGLSVEERISQVIDPPSYEIMQAMIDVVSREMSQ